MTKTLIEQIGTVLVEQHKLLETYKANNKELQNKVLALGEAFREKGEAYTKQLTELIEEEIGRRGDLSYVETVSEEQDRKTDA